MLRIQFQQCTQERYNLIIDNETYPVEMKYHTLTFVGKEGKTIEIPFIYTKEGMEILRESPLYGKKMTRFDLFC